MPPAWLDDNVSPFPTDPAPLDDGPSKAVLGDVLEGGESPATVTLGAKLSRKELGDPVPPTDGSDAFTHSLHAPQGEPFSWQASQQPPSGLPVASPETC